MGNALLGMLKTPPTGQQFSDVRSRELGYRDAVLTRTKAAWADVLDVDASDMLDPKDSSRTIKNP